MSTTFKSVTTESIDMTLDAENLQFDLVSHAEDWLVFKSGDIQLEVRKSDLAEIFKRYPPVGMEVIKRRPRFGDEGFRSNCHHVVPCAGPCMHDNL